MIKLVTLCYAILYQLQPARDSNQRATLSCRDDITFGNKYWNESLTTLVKPYLETSPSSAATSLSRLPANTLQYGRRFSSQSDSSSSFNIAAHHNIPNNVM